MLNIIKKLISGPSELPEITALRAALAQNKADIAKFLQPWDRHDSERDPELQKIRSAFQSDITNTKLGESYVALHSELAAKAVARNMLFQIAHPIVYAANTARTRAALRPALAALIAHLETALDKAHTAEREHCEAFGLSHAEGPVAKTLNQSIIDAQGWLGRIDKASDVELPSIVNFVLGQTQS